MRLLLPLLLAFLGFAGGVAASRVVVPTSADIATESAKMTGTTGAEAVKKTVTAETEDGAGFEYVKLPNQFVVPVVQEGRVEALVVMSLSLEVLTGYGEFVYSREPKLRDGFLKALFDHANLGGFSGNFTASERIDLLRQSLLAEAKHALGNKVNSVLITDFARQEN
ncbi:flagellar basal body-associated FliL family protein [Thalassobius sp. MITS945101]|uniref:flagellar basal body-associated FliL family protein n=1 Tax=Thalassobius sp. MITS945101 TaxID=3096994 RepID=UPI003999DDCD